MNQRMTRGLRIAVGRFSRVRRSVVQLRLRWFINFRKRLVTAPGSASIPGTVRHNLHNLSLLGTRAETLVRAVAIVEDVVDGPSLIVGCRTEDDLFTAWSIGFTCVVGLDLISYSHHVYLGDMHEAPFKESSFDSVIVPYTLSYSADAQGAVDEFIRIVKPGGVVGIAVEFAVIDQEGGKSLLGDLEMNAALAEGSGYLIRSADQIVSLLGSWVDQVVVRYDGLRKRHHSQQSMVSAPSPVIVVATIKK